MHIYMYIKRFINRQYIYSISYSISYIISKLIYLKYLNGYVLSIAYLYIDECYIDIRYITNINIILVIFVVVSIFACYACTHITIEIYNVGLHNSIG